MTGIERLRKAAENEYAMLCRNDCVDIADQIEAEMMMLPRDRNGECIHVGDKVIYKCMLVIYVESIRYDYCVSSDGNQYPSNSCELVKPDTWTRLENDYSHAPDSFAHGWSEDSVRDLIRRAKRLAGVDE